MKIFNLKYKIRRKSLDFKKLYTYREKNGFSFVFKIHFLERVVKILSKSIKNIYIFNNNVSIQIYSQSLKNSLFFFKNHTNCQFKILIDMTCVDFPENQERFSLIYNLLSIRFRSRLRLSVMTTELIPVESVISLYPCANWLEREIWDMFGILFTNHPDLRRILNDYGFEGFSLRKDFPLMGFVEVRYDDEQRRIVYEPVELAQQYRSFNFVNPWERFINQKIDGKPFFKTIHNNKSL